ncbi:hypothetical protein GCM10007161_13640 [Ignatzschineria indica]|uniref:Uncharacterized protein n=1 Tax=Ignatzschineria indica TaxID=472583 RepID=A0A2U2AJS5_9GAMM|nr:hypothetical protein [Ignatzschineria indica]PWD83040.1 hypothetical protein DC082_06340 [Ignatzschineria indica]GGZ83388.1 hypothetical protein GCM10007161_13640 [Ignatzschineria indica]
MKKFIKSRLIKADLIEIDSDLSKNGIKNMSSMVMIKYALVTIANLVDFESTLRSLYKENPHLSHEYKKTSKEFDFGKYLRNKFIGHIKDELLEKAIEWRPEILYAIQRTNEQDVMFVYNLYILETAINTYINADGEHKVFDSETDLFYPPDTTRFLIFITTIVRSGIHFMTLVGDVLLKDIDILDPDNKDLMHWLRAGETEFEYIRK